MTYIVERTNRFYVAYDGIDPATGRENAAAGTQPATTEPTRKRSPRGSTRSLQPTR